MSDELVRRHRCSLVPAAVARSGPFRGGRLYQKLGENACALGDPEKAVRHHGDALTVASELGLRPEGARAHAGLARAHRDLGCVDLARKHAERPARA
jgi:hypothetical protein